MLGLEMGAVDYVVKPFRLAELLARMRRPAALRRRRERRPAAAATARRSIGDVTHRQGRHAGSTSAPTRSPCGPRSSTCSSGWPAIAGVVVTREQLIDDVWDENWWGSTKTLDVHINAVRRKLGEQPGGPSRIATIRGVGYRLDGAQLGGAAAEA